MKKIQVKRNLLTLLLVALFAAPAGLTAQQSTVEPLLRQCADIDHDRQRLACYDQVFRPAKFDKPIERPAAETLEATEPVVTQAPQSAPAVVEETPPVEDNFGLKEKPLKETVTRTVTIIGIAKNLTDKFLFRTEDDHVWVQTDTRRVRYDEVPFTAEIRTAALGSFSLKSMASGVSVKVRRIK